MVEEIKVKDIMVRSVFKCKLNDTIREISKIMKKKEVGSIVVVKGKNPAGIVTREDIVDKVIALDKDPNTVLVSEIMSSPLITCGPEDSISEAAKMMNLHGFERIPVKYIDALIGIITIRDILRVAPGLIDIFGEHFEKEEAFDYGSPEDELMTSGVCDLCGNTSSLKEINGRWVCDSCREESAEL